MYSIRNVHCEKVDDNVEWLQYYEYLNLEKGATHAMTRRVMDWRRITCSAIIIDLMFYNVHQSGNIQSCISNGTDRFIIPYRNSVYECTGIIVRLYRMSVTIDITWIIHIYNPFHKTLPRYSLQMNLISVRFYESGDTRKYKCHVLYQLKCTINPLSALYWICLKDSGF